jgi:hypothetical protein
MAELADAAGLGPAGRKPLGVQIPLPAPTSIFHRAALVRQSPAAMKRAGFCGPPLRLRGLRSHKQPPKITTEVEVPAVSNTNMKPFSAVLLRKALSWLIVVQTVVLGVLIIGVAGAREQPPGMMVAILAIGFAAILGSFVATRNPKTACLIVLWVAPITPLLVGLFFPLPGAIALGILVVTGATLIPGLYWVFTSRRNWPLPLEKPVFPNRPILARFLAIGLSAVLIAMSIFLCFSLPWWPPMLDCSGGPLLNEQGAPRSTDFTAKILFVGPASYWGLSFWAIARVEQRFSREPWSILNLVVLRNFFHPSDKFEWFFIEGHRSRGMIARFLPVIERDECGHSRLLKNAAVPLRILHDGAPPVGVRILGRVYDAPLYTSPPERRTPTPGASVVITGPGVKTVVVTDDDGIFDVSGLPVGQYSVEIKGSNRGPGYELDMRKVPIVDLTLFMDTSPEPNR